VLEHVRDHERREAVHACFREVQDMVDILAPDPSLRSVGDDEQRLGERNRLVRGTDAPHVPMNTSFLRKTAEIVRQHTPTAQIREPQATDDIGPQALLARRDEDNPDTVTVCTLLKERNRIVAEPGTATLHLIPIGERAEAMRCRGASHVNPENAAGPGGRCASPAHRPGGTPLQGRSGATPLRMHVRSPSTPSWTAPVQDGCCSDRVATGGVARHEHGTRCVGTCAIPTEDATASVSARWRSDI
jgi:hypothetical protein